MRLIIHLFVCIVAVACAGRASAQTADPTSALTPGSRVLLDAHNSYPEDGRFADRITRALGTGLPVAIEQDLVWYRDPITGRSRSVVSHGAPLSGREPSLDQYFFTTVRPQIEAALRRNDRSIWPVAVLNLDFKTNEPEHLQAVWDLLGRYESWLTTAPRTGNTNEVAPLTPGPLLVLTGSAMNRSACSTIACPLVSGSGCSVRSTTSQVHGPTCAPTIGAGGTIPGTSLKGDAQPKAGAWTAEEDARLNAMVKAAHRENLWIRFYTLDGYDPADTSNGWSPGYNFGSLEAAQARWSAAIKAGVDFIAVNQYEEFVRFRDALHLAASRSSPASPLLLTGILTRDDYEALLERSFDVPPGTERIDIALTYDDRERTVIDLGLAGPGGFRGWSGGGPQQVHVAAHSASFGYSPGGVEAGRWKVILGVPNLRPGVTATYQLRITFNDSSPAPALVTGPGWYAGDLHSHSGHSDGRTAMADGTRRPVPPEHVFNAASRAGLDFVALTDHNTASHWADVDRLQPLFPALLLLHGREVTTYQGHLNVFGERRFADFRLGPGRDVARLVGGLNGGGTLLSINHPSLPDDESCMGCGWNDRSDPVMRGVQAVEIVNGDRVEGDQAGWQFWAGMLNRGYRLVAVGGSDEHTPDETGDRRIGRPATVVYASGLAEDALLQGIRAGHVYIRTRGAEGTIPRLLRRRRQPALRDGQRDSAADRSRAARSDHRPGRAPIDRLDPQRRGTLPDGTLRPQRDTRSDRHARRLVQRRAARPGRPDSIQQRDLRCQVGSVLRRPRNEARGNAELR